MSTTPPADIAVRFWGVRGSIPCPGPPTVRYGGNTACLELRFAGRLIIIDAGSGLRELGDYLLAHDMRQGPLDTSLYLTHTHWDHIMGFPFFTPIYIPSTRLQVFGPVTHEDETLESIVGGQMVYRYFPVRQTELAADIRYADLKEGVFDLGGGLVLRTKYLNHPVLCLGYRFEFRGKSVCTAYDTEPFANLFAAADADPALAAEGAAVAEEQNRLVEDFFAGADLVIHDAQYTEAEYQDGKQGWGHSSMEHAIEAAHRAGVRTLALFHHDPQRSDDELEQIVANLPRAPHLEVIIAREGLTLNL